MLLCNHQYLFIYSFNFEIVFLSILLTCDMPLLNGTIFSKLPHWNTNGSNLNARAGESSVEPRHFYIFRAFSVVKVVHVKVLVDPKHWYISRKLSTHLQLLSGVQHANIYTYHRSVIRKL